MQAVTLKPPVAEAASWRWSCIPELLLVLPPVLAPPPRPLVCRIRWLLVERDPLVAREGAVTIRFMDLGCNTKTGAAISWTLAERCTECFEHGCVDLS